MAVAPFAVSNRSRAPETSAAPVLGLGVPFFNPSASIDAAIDACGSLPPVVSGSTDVGAPTARVISTEGVPYRVVEQRREFVNDVVEHAFLQDLAAAGVYPGALIQGQSLLSGDVAPIGPLKRAPGEITVVTDVVTTSPRSRSRRLEKVDLASVTQARIALLKELDPKDSPGLLKAEFQQARTMREAAARLGVSVKGATFGVDANAALHEEYRQSTVVAVVRQVFYTVAFTPEAPAAAGMFHSSVKAKQLQRYIGMGNPPLFVDTVHYGRFICLTIQGSYSARELTAALKASVDASITGTVEIDARSKEILNSSTVKIYTNGVPGARNFQTLRVTLTELDRVFKQGLRFSMSNPGAPIAFTCRHVADSTVAHVGVVASFIHPSTATTDDVFNDQLRVWDGPDGGLRDTAIDVAPGDHVAVGAEGQVWSGVWGAGTHGPEGWRGHRADPAAPMPRGTAYCLILRFGMADWQEAGSSWTGENTSGRTARLQLNINDNNPYNGDRDKQWRITVHVRRRSAEAAGIFV